MTTESATTSSSLTATSSSTRTSTSLPLRDPRYNYSETKTAAVTKETLSAALLATGEESKGRSMFYHQVRVANGSSFDSMEPMSIEDAQEIEAERRMEIDSEQLKAIAETARIRDLQLRAVQDAAESDEESNEAISTARPQSPCDDRFGLVFQEVDLEGGDTCIIL